MNEAMIGRVAATVLVELLDAYYKTLTLGGSEAFAVSSIFTLRAPANETLRNHPSVPVDENGGFGCISLINVAVRSGDLQVASCHESDVPETLIGFSLWEGEAPATAVECTTVGWEWRSWFEHNLTRATAEFRKLDPAAVAQVDTYVFRDFFQKATGLFNRNWAQEVA